MVYNCTIHLSVKPGYLSSVISFSYTDAVILNKENCFLFNKNSRLRRPFAVLNWYSCTEEFFESEYADRVCPWATFRMSDYAITTSYHAVTPVLQCLLCKITDIVTLSREKKNNNKLRIKSQFVCKNNSTYAFSFPTGINHSRILNFSPLFSVSGDSRQLDSKLLVYLCTLSYFVWPKKKML